MIRSGVKERVIAMAHSGDTALATPRLRRREAALNPPARGV
jgi:hypothetical protein